MIDRSRVQLSPAPCTASNPEQVANLLCAHGNSASYPQRDEKWVVAYPALAMGWRPSMADWGGGKSASCTASPIFVSAGNEWPRNAYFTPPTRTRHNCLVLSCRVHVGGTNWIGDKTRRFCPVSKCSVNWVLSYLDLVSNLQLFSLKYTEDYWKLSCLVANSVHTTGMDKTRLVLSCPYRRCEIGIMRCSVISSC